MTPEEARERWPENIYGPETLGGRQRDIIVRFHQLAQDIRDEYADKQPTAQAAVEIVLQAAEQEIAAGQRHIDELQQEGLRRAFRELMGYDLPGEGENP